MIITHKISMDLARFDAAPRFDAVQDDRYSRNVELSLYDHGEAWAIPADATAVISYEKPDNRGGQYDTMPDGTLAWRAADNVLTLALAPQVLTAAGLVSLSVQLILGDAVLSTFRFFIEVHPNVAAGLFRSEDYVNLQQWCLPIFEQKINSTGWTPNCFLGTNAAGTVVARARDEILPAVTAADEGKFLRARSGAWVAEALTDAEGEAY